MVDLTRLNGTRLILNCDLIKSAEATPDTTLTLVTGEKLVILDPLDELIMQVVAYRAKVLRGAWPSAQQSLVAVSANSIFQSANKE